MTRVWVVPPACQGQIVEYAYLSAVVDGIGFVRITDRSSRQVRYACAELTADEIESWDPINTEPDVRYWTSISEANVNRILGGES